jgi:SAM-dependent methyltransferase
MNDDVVAAAHEHNRRAWDAMVRERQRFTRAARDEDFADPLKTLDGLGWLGGDVRGRRILCLAAGGGRQAPLYAAAGAVVAVVDISPAMLELDREVARERKLHLRTVETSMDDLSMFEPGEFDAVVHPVSTCYTPDVQAVFRQVARVTRAGGLYISQHKQPASLQADITPAPRGYELIEPYYRRGPLPPVAGSPHREEGAWEYLHRWEELIGGMCRAGFAIEDLIEPLHADPAAERGSFGHRSRYVAPYVRILARRSEAGPAPEAGTRLWTPRK